MISVAEALERISVLIPPVQTEWIDLSAAGGRMLSEPVQAKRAQPPFAASAMDGYAVRAMDLHDGADLKVVGHIPAGQMPTRAIGPGEAMRIFTGAPVPDGANHILIQEDAELAGDQITVKPGRDDAGYIRPAGSDFAADFTLEAPRHLSDSDVALLAAMNQPRIPVARRPVVALVPTGDELVWPGGSPRPDQIIASNNFGLASKFRRAGADVRLLPIAKDTPEGLMQVLDLAAGADLIVTLGGASVGDHDLVASVAGNRGLDLSFYKLAMRPGKPLMAGKLGDAIMIGLPGNPVSSLVCGEIFVVPAIRAMQGLPLAHPEVLEGILGADLGANGPRAHYMRASLIHDGGQAVITPATRQDSSLLTVLSGASALLIRPPNEEARTAGAKALYCPLG